MGFWRFGMRGDGLVGEYQYVRGSVGIWKPWRELRSGTKLMRGRR